MLLFDIKFCNYVGEDLKGFEELMKPIKEMRGATE